MWKSHSLFGIGGWGYRYLLPLYVGEERQKDITDGKANVHCDPAQQLAEFGALGFALLVGAVGWLAVPWFRLTGIGFGDWWREWRAAREERRKRRRLRRTPVAESTVVEAVPEPSVPEETVVPDRRVELEPVFVAGAAGLVVVVVHSLFDLPFRSPGVICAWAAIAAAVPSLYRVKVPGEPEHQEPERPRRDRSSRRHSRHRNHRNHGNHRNRR
jgi:hypothetical protein